MSNVALVRVRRSISGVLVPGANVTWGAPELMISRTRMSRSTSRIRASRNAGESRWVLTWASYNVCRRRAT